MALLQAADVIELAMELEKSGEVFYRAVANKAASPELKALFTDLAEQEVMHYKTFAKLSEALRDRPLMTSDEWGEYQMYAQVTIQSALFEGPDKALAAAESVKDEKEAVAMAMGFEKETMLFFHDLRDMATAADQEIIGRIIAQERRHLRRLADML